MLRQHYGHEFPRSLPSWHLGGILSDDIMVLSFPNVSHPGILEALSGKMIAIFSNSFPTWHLGGML